MPDLAAVETRIWSLLEPYRTHLEEATIYGMPSLRWPGAKAHDYFAAVKPAAKHVGLYLLPVEAHPDALAGAPASLLRRQTGKIAFTFPELDDEMAAPVRRTQPLDELLRRVTRLVVVDGDGRAGRRETLHDDRPEVA